MGNDGPRLKNYKELIGKHEGESAFLVGCGTSLFRQYTDDGWNEIFNHVVVSVNSSIIIMPWEEGCRNKRYWVSVDPLCRTWKYYHNKVMKWNMNIVVSDSWRKHYEEIPDAYLFRNRKNIPDDGLMSGSSILAALDLCIQMGCKVIYLLGVDQYTVRRKSHFWQLIETDLDIIPHRYNGMSVPTQSNIMQEVCFRKNLPVFEKLKDFAVLQHVDIYNCSKLSKVAMFPKIKFEESIKRSKENGVS